ncbi:MAG: hypothetical protein JWP65_2079 [Ramlibacter sp.]|jgi:hypothetical protein|uniref:hypothetical protein n=1 Tax=Ramlibacter sp. TaxID=1917967 RepID=UPI002623CE1D|nr:hypothetical protein [Ramlibacter sp.]MDB5751658.1 hypothetical protein [Ramlibacter sp.]
MGTLAAAAACAQRATAWLECRRSLEFNASASTEGLRLCHQVRNRLGSLQAALDVAAISAPGSDAAHEAHAIAARQSATLAALLDDLQEAAWAAR